MLLRRPLAISLALLALVASCVPLACSSSDSPPPHPSDPAAGPPGSPAPGDVIVGVVIDGPTQVTSIVAVDASYEARTAVGPKLHWELRTAMGVVASGDVTDPRLYAVEIPDDARKLHHYDGRSNGGAFEIRVPNVGGELVLRDDAAELRRAQVPTLTVGQTSLLLANEESDPPGSGLSSTGLKPQAGDAGAGAAASGPVKIVDHGECPGNLNVLIMPEGYTAAEMDKFHEQALTIAGELSTVAGWAQQYDRVNVWRQDVASRQSGISDPGCKGNDPLKCTDGPHARAIRNTAWNVQYGQEARRGAWWATAPKPSTWALYQRAKRTSKATILFVLINSQDHIGAAMASEGIIVQSAASGAGVVLGHEMGHAVLDLADEYDYGTCALRSAGSSPNTTKSSGAPPWKDIVTTPPVEGAEYCVKGVWRPQEHCLMRELDQPFCPVCMKKLETVFEARMKPHAKVESCQRPLPDCAIEEGQCEKAFPGRNLVCSNSGGGKSCCRTPFAATKTCFSDDDCTAGELCALATNDADGGGPQFSCITPASQPCIPPPAAGADGGAP
jgi:hypothetical protein